MPLITVGFNQNINVSVQAGDLAWYVSTSMQGVQGNQYSTGSSDNIILIGKITAINANILTIEKPANVPPPLATDFIMFSKDNRASTSGILGYYANAKFVNNSKEKIELFAVGSEIFESSK